jgi:hypothetical protein
LAAGARLVIDDVDEIEVISGPRITTIRAASASQNGYRLDAKYFQEEFTLAKARALQCGLPIVRVRDIADVFVPGRMKLVTVPSSEAGAPYLKAHGAFKTLPTSERFVASARTENYESYLLREGMILTPSSGRNLGPTCFVGKSMTRFGMTDIMRIAPRDNMIGLYLLTYLRTSIGQSLIRRGRTGTNIDHLAPGEVLDLVVVWPEENIRLSFAKRMQGAVDLLESARQTLEDVAQQLTSRLRLGEPSPTKEIRSFSTQRSQLSLRLDAAFYDDRVRQARTAIAKRSHSLLRDAAELRMLGRYKRYYVGASHGRPILSGTQLLQLFPVNLKAISDRSFSDPGSFELSKGWTLMTCDGRAEEGLGSPAFVSSLWDGWLASNHVMRAVPRAGVSNGYLYASLCLPQVQIQIKAAATGSVIDALDPQTLGAILIPRLEPLEEKRLGALVEVAWEQIAESVRTNGEIVGELEKLLRDAYENSKGSTLSASQSGYNQTA